jgi:cyclopropane-fatty-acyl-phospholipid synthase
MLELFQKIAASTVPTGNLRVTTANGRTFTLGDGSGKPVAVRFTSTATEIGVLLDPELKLPEAYMDGTFIVEQGSILDFLTLVVQQDWAPPQWQLPRLWRQLQNLSSHSRARTKEMRDILVEGSFYSLFLDADRNFSCAYFERPDYSLDDAQLAKKRHIAAKLLVTPASRVLDIGCGWGSLVFYLAQKYQVHVTGITVSRPQIASAKSRAKGKTLTGTVEFRCEDYCDVTGIFDRIVSIEMMQDIGVEQRDTFFRKCAQLLAQRGVILLHVICRSEGPALNTPFVSKYFFPDSYIPALSELLPAIEAAGLLVTDIEFQGQHAVATVRAWRERLLARRDECERLYNGRFFRMLDFFLAGEEFASKSRAMICQIQMAKQRDAVPITRDYIAHEESRLRSIEEASRPQH